MKSFITTTFGITGGAAVALASAIIWCAGLGTKKALIVLACTGVGACIAATLIGIGLSYIAKKYKWDANRLSHW
ncbi:MAG: hypothetical protein GX275_03090 [Clostridiales bacterium]|nr:hypothetical protein [Clostridiales bacterium]